MHHPDQLWQIARERQADDHEEARRTRLARRTGDRISLGGRRGDHQH